MANVVNINKGQQLLVKVIFPYMLQLVKQNESLFIFIFFFNSCKEV